MRSWSLALISVLVLACGKDDTGDAYGIIEGDLSFDDGEAASVAGHKAFGYDRNGVALLYFAANANTTCADVAGFLDGDRDVDPDGVFTPGHCNVFAQVQDFDGGEVTYVDDRLKVTWNLSCAIGDGSWNWEERGDDDDFYWSGRLWSGGPGTFAITLSGGGGSAYIADVSLDDYDGNYIYEGLDDAPASGAVTGVTRLQWCDDLSETPFFGS